MKKIKILILTLFFSITYSFAQNDTVWIKTSAQCEICKSAIEHQLNFEKGVKSAILDIATKDIIVIYNSKKTNPEQLRKSISMIGYDADSIKADAKAYEKLHACCKKDGHNHD